MNKSTVTLMGAVFAMNRLDLESPQGIFMMRVGFIISCLYCSVAYFWVYSVIDARKDRTLIEKVPATDSKPAVMVTKYAYDLERIMEMIRSYTIWLFFMVVMHFQMGMVKPMFLTMLLNTTTAVDNHLFKIHVLGHDDEAPDLTRPWPPPSLWLDLGLITPPTKARKPPQQPAVASGKAAVAQVTSGAPSVEQVAGSPQEADKAAGQNTVAKDEIAPAPVS